MKNHWSGRQRAAYLFVTLAAILVLVVSVAYANVKDEGGDVPAYARLEEGVPNDGEWAAVFFYRPPECVPADFNMIEFFDIPRVFECGPPTTGGFNIWEYGLSPEDPVPLKSSLKGLGAVPVWFTSYQDMANAYSDGIVTIVELEGLPSLTTGIATFFSEELHPSGGPANSPMLNIVANGSLEDGRTFQVHAILNSASYPHGNHVTITFR